jgi:uncharacterized protein YuzE
VEKKTVRVWFDPEGDFLEVMFADAPGYFRETVQDQVMEKVDMTGAVIGFSIMNVSTFRGQTPVEVALS